MDETELIPLRRDPLLPARDVPVVWRRTARARRVSLRVDPVAGAAVVTLPQRAARACGVELLEQHSAWVLKQIESLAPALAFVPDAVVPVGGAPHVVRHDPARRRAEIAAGEIRIGGTEEGVPRRVERLLRAEALRRLSERALHHAAALEVRPRAIRLKDTRTRWGSCAPDRTLNFTWRLVMAPDWVLDYVVAHEVAHLREMNHSARFWALCESRSPHRAAATAWLRRNGPALLRAG